MKKFLLSVCFSLIACGLLQAQTERGNLLLGGNAGLNLYKADGQGKYSFNLDLNPKVGFFLVDNLAVGAQVWGDIRKRAGINGVNSQILFGPFGRYYFHNLFLEANVGVYDRDVFAGMGLGYAFFVTNNVAIEPIANARFSDGIEFNFLVGFQLYFTADELRDAF